MQESVSYIALGSMLIGGLGLFLLAVGMITDGLRYAAGGALRDLLARGTATPVRGIVSGLTITAIVQSSSALTVATIGFVNAGLLTLYQSLGVVYGANIGTTMTGWLVAAIGFKIKVEAFALPMIGIGMLVHLLGQGRRLGALGRALAGFGLFFIGIDVLREAFTGFATAEQMAGLSAETLKGVVLSVGVGFLMTVLTQSSSAAIALILTATTGGVLDLSSAAAMVIGANVGTTSTAAFAVIGATSNAKRVAAAHITFNVATGLVAILLLPGLLLLVELLGQMLKLEQAPAVVLALFHTVFNVLGVLLMMPFSKRLADFLCKRFRSAEEVEGAPRYLDGTLAATPALALSALRHELGHVDDIVRRMSLSALSTESTSAHTMTTDKDAVHRLSMAIGDFVSHVGKASMSGEVSGHLSQVLRISDYYQEIAALATELSDTEAQATPLDDARVLAAIAGFHADVVELLQLADPDAHDFDLAHCEQHLHEAEEVYRRLKETLLEAGASRRIRIPAMSGALDQIARIRDIMRQSLKAARYLAQLDELVAAETGAQTGNHQAEETAQDKPAAA